MSERGIHYEGENSWEDEDEEEEEEFKQQAESFKEKLIFLIDVQDNMFEEITLYGELTTSFEAARRAVVELLKLKAVQQPDDQIAVVLYNTREKDRPGEEAAEGETGGAGAGGFVAAFEGVRTFLALQQPSAEAVRAVRDLSVEDFQSTIGGLPQRRTSSLADAFFRVQNCLVGSKTADKSNNTVVVFTNDAEPCGPQGSPGFKAALAQLSSRVEALQGYHVGARLFPLAAAVRPFDSGRLWRGLLRALPGRPSLDSDLTDPAPGGDDGSGGSQGDDEAMLRELATDPSLRRDPIGAITSLFDSFKRRLARKRVAMRLRWQISEELKIAVKGYLLVSNEATAAKKTVPMNPVTNQPLKITTTIVSTSDGRVLEKEALGGKRTFALKTGDRSRLPQVVLPASEVTAAGTGAAGLVPPGLVLLGFKPLTPCLRRYYVTRPSIFLRPDERTAEGSTAAFIALWRAMLAEGRFAVCRHRRANAAPRLVALVPQDEALNEYGIQSEPPGIHMIVLPYMDDVRHPETATGVPPQRPSGEQLAAADALVTALNLETVEPFDLTQHRNPWLQRHYQIVEALALSESLPEWNPLEEDTTRPPRELFDAPAARQAVEAFRAAFPQTAAGRGTKRKAEGEVAESRAKKAAAVGEAYDAINWEEALRGGKLAKFTVDQLKIYLRHHGLLLGGKKDDLVARVSSHMSEPPGTGGA